ncbi:S-layer homology domain-containing protein [Nitriliruptor alkaliphilus]|uniref:S-layer homology domain-containing protein n=1 Tax=Nitriliruptor alkaliphilus TaxID=427918 RepID=UPI00069665D2|nr:S-layer homology domain-containing protein [Nitriliruptor alkaliphilus]
MNRQRLIRRPLAGLLALTALSALGAPITAASAATTATSVTVTDPVGDAEARSGAPLPAPGAADLVAAGVTHGTNHVTFVARVAGGPHPLEDGVRDQELSMINWAVDTGGDATAEFWASVQVLDGAYVGEVWHSQADQATCSGTVAYHAATFTTSLKVPRTCLDSPAEIRVYAYSRYMVSAPDTAYHDWAPDQGGGTPVLSDPAARTRIATSLSSAVSASSVPAFSKVTVSGKLTRTDGGAAVTGQKVTLQRRPTGGSFATIATTTTDSKGNVSFTIAPTASASYRLVHSYAGRTGPGFDSATSPTRTIDVTAATDDNPACAAVPAVTFPDVAGPPHGDAIGCVAGYGIAKGQTDGTYQPDADVRRDQMTSFLARTLRASGVELPANPKDRFSDDNGSTHELAINQLAELGIVQGRGGDRFSPANPVTREQMASFLIRTLEVILEQDLAPTGPSPFTDTAGSAHADNIDVAAQLDIAKGRTATTYEPTQTVRRDQMASFIARSLRVLHAEGVKLTPVS